MCSSTVPVRIGLLPAHDRRPNRWLEVLRARLAQSFRVRSSTLFRPESIFRSANSIGGLQPSHLESAAVGTRTLPRFRTASMASELGVLLALSVMFPFMLHVLPVPEDARLGPRLLPMYYAPLLAALLGRTRSALIVAVAAPWLNRALTTHPAPRGAVVMMLQLLVFVWVVRASLEKFGARWFLAAPAYVACWAAAMVVAAIFPDLIGARPVVGWVLSSVTLALPGLAILILINWLAVRYYPPGPGGGPIAA